MGIEKAICKRILFQISTFTMDDCCEFVNTYYNPGIPIFDHILNVIGTKYKCFILGIDDLSKIYKYPKKIENEDFKDLFRMIEKYSCKSPIFFVPILSGTSIGVSL